MSEPNQRALRAPSARRLTIAAGMAICGMLIAPMAMSLEEIVVTAQKRDQRLIDVPISVSVVDADYLTDRTTYYLTDLGQKLPNVVAGDSFASSFTIRGITSSSAGSGFAPSMGVNVDEVFMGRDRSFDTGVIDVAQVELLRGPQGTLYGKNTIAGTINVTTQRPTNEFEAVGNLRYGNRNLLEARGTLSGPIVEDTFLVRANVFARQRDGYIRNRSLDKDVNDTDNWGGRIMAIWTPAEKLDIELRADYYKQDENGGVSETLRTPDGNILPFPPFSTVPPQNGTDRAVNQDRLGFLYREVKGYSAKIDYDLGGYTLTGITAWREQDSDQLFDNDGGPLDGFDTGRAEAIERFSQEVRLTSPEGDRFSWIVGAYFDHEEDTNDYHISVGPGFPTAILPPVLGFSVPLPPTYREEAVTNNKITSESWSAFVSGTYDLTERLILQAGLRYTDEEKKLFYSQGPTVIAAPPNSVLIGLFSLPFTLAGFPNGFSDRYEDTAMTGDISLSYAFGNDQVAYLRYARGYKAGGFQSDVISPPFAFTPGVAPELSFEPETLDAYEVGFKGAWLDGTLLTTVAAFYYDFKDKQEQVNSGVSFLVSNAASAESKGVELELVWATPVEGLNLFGNIGVLDAQYESFPLGGGPGTDFGGNDLAGAPSVSGSFGGDFTRAIPALAGVNFRIALDADHRGDYYTDANNSAVLKIEDYTLYNGRIGLEQADGKWALYAWGQNLTDETVLGGGVTVLGGLYLTRSINFGRAYGLELNVRL
ncbi:MAG: TonB-dependent receptor [Pseudomonadales bacterium]|nr:TonB-dependent receptor [Pseudomonadales bacterium]